MPIEWPGPDDLSSRAGQCYTLAMQMVLANIFPHGPRLFLVHGLLHPERAEAMSDWDTHHPGLPIPPVNPHAWVEIDADDGTLSLDPVIRLAKERTEYERMYGIEVIRRYRSDVAFDCAMRHDNYGPWDKRSMAEWRKRQHIAQSDPRFSQDAAVERFLRRDGQLDRSNA